MVFSDGQLCQWLRGFFWSVTAKEMATIQALSCNSMGRVDLYRVLQIQKNYMAVTNTYHLILR